MRRTAVLAAVAATSVISVGLIASSAQAAAAATRLVGTASCVGGGHIRLATSIGADRTAKAVATVSGVTDKRWAGQLYAGIDQMTSLSSQDAVDSTKYYTAHRGTFTAVATRPGASSATAVAVFAAAGLRSTCTEMVVQHGTQQYLVADADMTNGLVIGAGVRSALDASITAVGKHHYRATFTVVGRGAPQRIVLEKTAHRRGVIDIVARHVRRLSAFTKVTLTITDLSAPTSQTQTYSIGR